MFEAIHGTAPRLIADGEGDYANPASILKAAELLLRYIAILPIALIMSYLFQAVGVWHSFWITELLSAVVSCILFWRLFYKDCTKQSCECV